MTKIVQLADYRRRRPANGEKFKPLVDPVTRDRAKAIAVQLALLPLKAIRWALFFVACLIGGVLHVVARWALMLLVPAVIFCWFFRPGLSVTWAFTAFTVFVAFVPWLWALVVGLLQPRPKSN